jgi:hypothetical protein
MMKYVDHYEVESRNQDGVWEHVAVVYPNYQWRTGRLWLLFGLVCRAKIVNNAEAAALRARCEVANIALALIKGDAKERFRIWEYGHNGWWLTKEIDAEFGGSLI